jgi:hypothetical protein
MFGNIWFIAAFSMGLLAACFITDFGSVLIVKGYPTGGPPPPAQTQSRRKGQA